MEGESGIMRIGRYLIKELLKYLEGGSCESATGQKSTKKTKTEHQDTQ